VRSSGKQTFVEYALDLSFIPDCQCPFTLAVSEPPLVEEIWTELMGGDPFLIR
jgi:hypothetical protein